LLTTKPVLYICNIDESDITEPENNENYKKFSDFIKKQNSTSQIIPLAITMEYEISKLSDEEKSAFLLDLGIKEAGLDTLINAVYKLLGIQTFFTFGKDETRA
jgi:ribosome-binding ATPase YchF (GTP1/OBG family)